ncbi:macro domain-containing protein [Nostoc sp. NMS4]|uniref:macro domain-containing protein n=1 Tax=Nostoc sp. NMS4 TaxID=2815390 RepID=UPI0025D42859|nr:macro domain-containing protein [Nostoc sp. NMS4]
MFEFKQGNLLEEKAEALVNTVNCVGVMGKGIALQFKQAYPENFRHYEKACKANEVQPGRMFTVATGSLLNPKYIINFPTKRHWRNNSKIEDIKSGLVALVQQV